jgi:hypothetical protein
MGGEGGKLNTGRGRSLVGLAPSSLEAGSSLDEGGESPFFTGRAADVMSLIKRRRTKRNFIVGKSRTMSRKGGNPDCYSYGSPCTRRLTERQMLVFQSTITKIILLLYRPPVPIPTPHLTSLSHLLHRSHLDPHMFRLNKPKISIPPHPSTKYGAVPMIIKLQFRLWVRQLDFKSPQKFGNQYPLISLPPFPVNGRLGDCEGFLP